MGLHWLMLLLLVAVFAAMELSDGFPKGSDTRGSLKTLHFTLGLTVFTLVWARLIAKLVSPAPLIHPPIARWQEVTAKVVQALLYLLMIAMPLLGWAGLADTKRSRQVDSVLRLAAACFDHREQESRGNDQRNS